MLAGGVSLPEIGLCGFHDRVEEVPGDGGGRAGSGKPGVDTRRMDVDRLVFCPAEEMSERRRLVRNFWVESCRDGRIQHRRVVGKDVVSRRDLADGHAAAIVVSRTRWS